MILKLDQNIVQYKIRIIFYLFCYVTETCIILCSRCFVADPEKRATCDELRKHQFLACVNFDLLLFSCLHYILLKNKTIFIEILHLVTIRLMSSYITKFFSLVTILVFGYLMLYWPVCLSFFKLYCIIRRNLAIISCWSSYHRECPFLTSEKCAEIKEKQRNELTLV